MQGQDPQKALDPFDEDSDAKLTAIAKKFEEKYVSLHIHHLRAKTCDLLRMRRTCSLTFDPSNLLLQGPKKRKRKIHQSVSKALLLNLYIYSTYPYHFNVYRALFIYFFQNL